MINGILNIYKEKGYTSHDVVARLRGIVGQKKIGHTGTLDPEAEGVLPVCLGRATKVCDMLTDKDKTYETVLLLGKTTDTQDITGKVLSEHSPDDPGLPGGAVTEKSAEECISGFIGAYDQIPPMYSALKVGGKKLYELAREGKTVERKSRRVMIRDIRIKEIKLPRIRMEVDCSKGTYIRTLCHDIGGRLGCGGCMEELLRTRVGRFSLEESLKLDEVEQIVRDGRMEEILIPTDCLFDELKELQVKPEYDALVHNGNPVGKKQVLKGTSGKDRSTQSRDIPAVPDEIQAGGRVRVYDSRRNFIGIYRYDGTEGRFRPEKMFLDPEQIVTEREEN